MITSFSVAVFTDGNKTVEELLLPYKRNVCLSEDDIFPKKKDRWDWYISGGRQNEIIRNKASWEWDCSARVENADFSMDMRESDKAGNWWDAVVEGRTTLREPKAPARLYSRFRERETYGSREHFMECMSLFSTFAVVTPDGRWHEKGLLGWNSDIIDEDIHWEDNYKRDFLDTADKDWTITIVRCYT